MSNVLLPSKNLSRLQLSFLAPHRPGKRRLRRKLKRHNNRRRRKPTETRAVEDREVQLVKQTEDDVGKDSSHISSEINDLEISLELEDGQLAAPCSAPDTLNIKNDSFVSFVACGETQVNGGKENSNISYSPSYCEKSAYSSMCPTGRVSFKLYDWNPAEFPRRLRNQLLEEPLYYVQDIVALGKMLCGRGTIFVHLNDMVFCVFKGLPCGSEGSFDVCHWKKLERGLYNGRKEECAKWRKCAEETGHDEEWINVVNDIRRELYPLVAIPMIYGIDRIHGHNNVYKATIFLITLVLEPPGNFPGP
ncbi:hypothetical protein K1719_018613 [Acacia pycnantha]|nr:hypothetical protein K1719_018613 [Acacia pycnantha]